MIRARLRMRTMLRGRKMILSKTRLMLAASVTFAGCLCAGYTVAQEAYGTTTRAPIVVTGNGEDPRGPVKG